jgi:hypothetical protein
MAYRDKVLSYRPSLYYPFDLTATAANDVSGLGSSAFAGGLTLWGIVPISVVSAASGTVTNTPNICSNSNNTQAFSFDFLTSPLRAGNNTLTLMGHGTTSKVYFDYDRFVFEVVDSNGTVYHAWKQVPTADDVYHVAAVYGVNSIYVMVNGEGGDMTQLPSTFSWGTATTITIGAGVSHPSVYTRAVSQEEVQQRYQASMEYHDFPDVCIRDGGYYWDMTQKSNTLAANVTLDRNNWNYGTNFNCRTDKNGNLSMQDQPRLATALAGVSVTPTFNTNRLTLGSTAYATRAATGALSNTGCVIAGIVNSTLAGADKWILTILDNKTGNSWGWKVSNTGVVTMVYRTISPNGTETITNYAYTTATTANFNFAIWIEPGQVLLHSGGTGTTVNQYSGSNYISTPITITNDTTIIMGSNYDYTGIGVDFLNEIYFYQYLPAASTFSSNYDNLLSTTLATVYYLLDTNLNPKAIGTWQYTFTAPYSGTYVDHHMDWGGAESTFLTVAVSYNGSGFTTANKSDVIPNFPQTGTLGGAQVLGPFIVKVTLTTDDDHVGFLDYINFKIFSNVDIKALNSDKMCLTTTYNWVSNQENDRVYEGLDRPNMKITGTQRFEFESATYNTVELVCRVRSGTGEILCVRDNAGGTEYAITITGTTLSWVGFTNVYLNGATFTSGGTINLAQNLHLVATVAAGVTTKFSLAQHYTGVGTSPVMDVMGVAAYSSVLSAAQVTEHYAASRGLIVGSHTSVDSLSITDAITPTLYSYKWELVPKTT